MRREDALRQRRGLASWVDVGDDEDDHTPSQDVEMAEQVTTTDESCWANANAEKVSRHSSTKFYENILSYSAAQLEIAQVYEFKLGVKYLWQSGTSVQIVKWQESITLGGQELKPR